MTPVERLQAAIEKLEALREEASYFPWRTHRSAGRWHVLDQIKMTVARTSRGNAELIVTLHRTIDVQLAILRHAVKSPLVVFSGASTYDGHALALADAILGEA